MLHSERYAELFAGNADAHGTEHGGCDRTPPNINAHLHRGLSEGPPIGIYPMVKWSDGTWRVRWGIVDFDIRAPGKRAYDYDTETDAHIAATNLQRVLHHMDIRSWVEVTRSHGRHVWVFAQQAVLAAHMRRTLLVACQIAVVSAREVNPKQETLTDGQLGNYVRLPYPGADPHTRYMIDNDRQLTWEQFVVRAWQSRNPPERFAQWANRWQPPKSAAPPRTFTKYEGHLDGLLGRLDRAGRKVFHDGPVDGDRSDALSYIAHRCCLSGLTASEAFAVVDDAAARWDKFTNRKDRTQRLQRIVERGYA